MSTLDPRPPVRAPTTELASSNGESSLGALFGQLAQESSTLIRQEIGLAKAELRAGMRETTSGAAKVGIAAGVAAAGALVLIAFLVLLLGDLLDNYWLSALIIGAVLTLVGGVLAMSGIRKLKGAQLSPQATIETLKEDREWAKAEVRQAKQDLRT